MLSRGFSIYRLFIVASFRAFTFAGLYRSGILLLVCLIIRVSRGLFRSVVSTFLGFRSPALTPISHFHISMNLLSGFSAISPGFCSEFAVVICSQSCLLPLGGCLFAATLSREATCCLCRCRSRPLDFD